MLAYQTCYPPCSAAAASSCQNVCEVCRRAKVITISTEMRLCEACKKFHRRVKGTDLFQAKCQCSQSSSSSSFEDFKTPLATDESAAALDKCPICRPCRARKLRVLLSDTSMEGDSNDNSTSTSYLDDQSSLASSIIRQEKIDVALIPCEICGASSNGFHYGAVTCEGCKGFFRRTVLFQRQYKCAILDDAVVTSELFRVNSCKHCRFQACLDHGMSMGAVRRGRHSVNMILDLKERFERCQLMKVSIQRKISRNSRTIRSAPPSVSSSTSSTSSLSSFSSSSLPTSPTLISAPLTSMTMQFNSFMQQVVDASKYLTDISSSNCSSVDLVNNNGHQLSTPKDMWRMAVSGNIKTTVKAVSSFVCHLPGFVEVDHKTRRKLFSFSYFAITFAKLSVDFKNNSSLSAAGQLFALKNAESVRIFDDNFSYVADLLQKKLIAVANAFGETWSPSIGEFALFCGLLFFCPAVINGVSDDNNAEAIARLHGVYCNAYKETAKLRLLSNNQQVQADVEEEFARIINLLCEFRSTAQVFMDVLDWTTGYDSDSLALNPIWAEMHQLLTACYGAGCGSISP